MYALTKGGRALVVALTLVSVTASPVARLVHARAAAVPAKAAQNPIQIENALSGTSGWRITRPSKPGHLIEGYANLTSVNVAEQIGFYVNVVPAVSYTLDVFRMGWYGGKGGRLIWHAAALPGKAQSACPVKQSLRMVSCQWTRSYTFTVPRTAVSGVYLVLLTRADGYQSYISFVVRNDIRASPVLFQSSVNTAQAYNTWGGRSLYKDLQGNFSNRAYAVSFDRPNARGYGAGDFLFWEYPMVRWLERMGTDVTYQTDVDTDVAGGLLMQHRVFLSVGHDEYWTRSMRDHVENARNHGVSLAFFGANAAYWQVRFESSVNGPRRVMVCYKDKSLDPYFGQKNSLVTIQWRDPLIGRPEQAMIGQMYESEVNAPGSALRVENTTTWPFTGTGLHDGDTIPGIVGYEYDRIFSSTARPAGETVLAVSPVVTIHGAASTSNVTLYTAASGARVFSAGSIQWSWGLDDDDINAGDPNRDNHHVASAAMQRLTYNVLHAFSQ